MKNLTRQNPEQLFVAQELINKVKSKCCGIKVNNNYSSFWLTKGDYLRLKNLEIGYTFRQREFLTKLGVQSLRLYLAGTNLLTFTSLDDYDPEKLSTDSRNDVHPNTRTYSFGVNVKF